MQKWGRGSHPSQLASMAVDLPSSNVTVLPFKVLRLPLALSGGLTKLSKANVVLPYIVLQSACTIFTSLRLVTLSKTSKGYTFQTKVMYSYFSRLRPHTVCNNWVSTRPCLCSKSSIFQMPWQILKVQPQLSPLKSKILQLRAFKWGTEWPYTSRGIKNMTVQSWKV